MLIDTEDPRLTKHERDTLRRIALRLKTNQPRQPPASYVQELDRVFGSCAEEGNLSERGR